MKSTAFKITLGIWLAASVGFWLFGFSSFGWYLPRPGPWTLFLVYGPWLVLLVLLVADWGRRREVVAAKRAAIFVAALIALSIALYPQRDVVKERYFRAVLSSCQASQGGEIVWEDVPAFDGDVRRLRANSVANSRIVDCVNRLAGFLVTDLICPGDSPWPNASNALEVTSGTFDGIPPDRFFHIVHYEFAGDIQSPTTAREQCPQVRLPPTPKTP